MNWWTQPDLRSRGFFGFRNFSDRRYSNLSTRKLTVQDIMLMQRQLEAAEQLNNILGQAVAEIADVVSGLESANVEDKKVAAAVDKIKSAINKLEKEVEEFTEGLK